MLERGRDQLALDGALEQRIFDLDRDDRRPAAEAGDGMRLRATFQAGVSERPT